MKTYTIAVTQTDTYYKEFNVEAETEEEARAKVEVMVEGQPLDMFKNTYEGTDIEIGVSLKGEVFQRPQEV